MIIFYYCMFNSFKARRYKQYYSEKNKLWSNILSFIIKFLPSKQSLTKQPVLQQLEIKILKKNSRFAEPETFGLVPFKKPVS